MEETIPSIFLTFSTTNNTMLDAYFVLNNYLVAISFLILLYKFSNKIFVLFSPIISFRGRNLSRKIHVSCLLSLERSGEIPVGMETQKISSQISFGSQTWLDGVVIRTTRKNNNNNKTPKKQSTMTIARVY